MGDSHFFDNIEIINPEYGGRLYNSRQNINLSSYAWNILETDMFMFKGYDCELSSLINLIIQKYAPYSNANFCAYYKNFTSSLQPLLKTLTLSQSDADAAELAILKNAMDIHYNTHYKHTKGIAKKVHLSLESIQTILTISQNLTKLLRNGNIPDIPENIMSKYKWHSHFLNSVIEDYTTRPYYEREKYILSDSIRKIEWAIETKSILKTKHMNGGTIYIKPYRIILNTAKTYHYVCGYFSSDGNNYHKQPSATKLSNIIQIDETFETFDFSKETLDMINKKIQEDEVQFISSSDRLSPDYIKISLTKEGIRIYRQIGNIRPHYTRIEDGHIYYFDCTEIQAFYYFQSFGDSAVILEPESLKLKMKHFYEKGAEAYSE